MTALLLIVLAVVILAAISAVLAVIVILALYVYRRSILRALPPAPPPPLAVDCKLPGGALPTANDPNITLTGNEADSDLRGNTITLPAGMGFGVSGPPPTNLTLIAYGDLTIDGRIPIDRGSGGKLTLVSLTGTVTIGSTAVIGPSPATFSLALPVTAGGPYALALGAPGTTGGYIKIVAPVVIIEGTVQAEPGGSGGLASAAGTGSGPFGGTAVAVGGRGGFGGAVRICAEELIQVTDLAVIRGGDGGGGRNAGATAANGSRGLAVGGSGNDGGDVIFTGTGPGPCQVRIGGTAGFMPTVKGGNGGGGGPCTATGGLGSASPFSLLIGGGGTGTAIGGSGGRGGTVKFANCVVTPGSSIVAGSGGGGGAATATGGTGAPARAFNGYSGGDADAEGGDGGLIGERGSYPLIGGGTATVAPPAVLGGSGGNANATGGTGGTGGGSPLFAGGGNSGQADAVGGLNPNTGGIAVPATSAPVAGTSGAGGAGGVGPLTTSPGAP